VKTYEITFESLYPTLFSPVGSKVMVQVWGKDPMGALGAARERFDFPSELWQVLRSRDLEEPENTEKRGTCGSRAYEVTFVAPKHMAFGPEGERVTVQVLAEHLKDALDTARFRFDLPEGIWNLGTWRELVAPKPSEEKTVHCLWCQGEHKADPKPDDPTDCLVEEYRVANLNPTLSSLLFLIRALRDRINGLENLVKEKKE
jgi:hypothetical protein